MNHPSPTRFTWPRFALGILFALVLAFFVRGQLQSNDPFLDEVTVSMMEDSERLKPLHQGIGEVRPGDWLASHEESGQSFRQYLEEDPVTLTPERNVLYVQPIGQFSPAQQNIVRLSAEFMSLYFGCQIKILETLPIDGTIPAEARRVHPSWGVRQIKSTFVLDQVLKPNLPEDAFALIAFTSSDLYPADDWNFVFGQASLRHRVGVWSIFRNGNPETEFKDCLLRTLKTATHETGHMFSVRHCIDYDCNMCGSNSREESDRRPLYLCPQCVAKIWWATRCDPVGRFRQLENFCAQHGLADEATYYQQAASVLSEQTTQTQIRPDN